MSKYKTKNTSLEKILKTYKDIIYLLPGHVYWKDCDGVFLGCNLQQALDAGLSDPDQIVGKTDAELPWAVQAEYLRAIDKKVMSLKKTLILEEAFEYVPGEIARVYLSHKMPLYDDEGQVCGILGVSFDITAEKQKEDERLRLENEKQRLLLEEEEKFRKLANKVAHDIRSPLASLLMIVRECAQIPENHRIALRETATGIGDIANHLFHQYQKKETDSYESEDRQAILVSTTLMELLTAKKYQYKNLSVKFDSHFSSNTEFAFIRIQPSAFKRMVSNLINNAVDAFDNKSGEVVLQLEADKEWVKISIKDKGKGMPREMIDKIMNKTAFTAGKDSGHGIGLTQVWETLENNQGELHIDSKLGHGTTMTVTFPRTKAPGWIADEISLMKNDIVVILDDDTSIHGAWQTRFETIINKRNNIQLKHFQIGKEALNFIHSLEPEDKARILLLSDYELLNQELNGLHIIEKSQIKRSILVTSHYADALVRELSAKTGTKILPKQLASEVAVKFVDDLTKVYTKVDAVLVEDDESLSDKLVLYIFKDKVVDQYLNPEDLLRNLHRYAKETKIYLDNNYDNSPQKGIDVAKTLHEQGYERLYLLSGDFFRKGELPDYLTVIRKDDIDGLESSVNS